MSEIIDLLSEYNECTEISSSTTVYSQFKQNKGV